AQRRMGNIRSEGYARCNLGNALVRLDRPTEGEAELAQARVCAEKAGERRLLGAVLAGLAGLAHGAGRHAEALASATAGESELRAIRDPFELARILAIKAEILASLGLGGAW